MRTSFTCCSRCRCSPTPRSSPSLNEYRDYVTGGAWGILGLSFVVASIRYWLSSYSGAGAYEALMGFARTVGSIAMLLAFPIAFDQLVPLRQRLHGGTDR